MIDVALPDSRFEARVCEPGDGSVTLVLAGELDHSAAAPLAARLDGLLALGSRRLIFDLSGVSYASLGVLRVVVLGPGRRPRAFLPLLRQPAPIVLRLLTVSGLAQHCLIEPCP